jgi:NADH-quinone oxidoreductase subunit K
MIDISLETGLLLSGILFALGLTGVMIRRNIVFMLMSIEIMLNAAGLAFIFSGAFWHQADGQVMFLFILAVAAAEVSVGLGLIILIYKKFKTLDIDELSKMKG